MQGCHYIPGIPGAAQGVVAPVPQRLLPPASARLAALEQQQAAEARLQQQQQVELARQAELEAQQAGERQAAEDWAAAEARKARQQQQDRVRSLKQELKLCNGRVKELQVGLHRLQTADDLKDDVWIGFLEALFCSVLFASLTLLVGSLQCKAVKCWLV